jgi:hypothetical protein
MDCFVASLLAMTQVIVIASGAKQSIAPVTDCRAPSALAMTGATRD